MPGRPGPPGLGRRPRLRRRLPRAPLGAAASRARDAQLTELVARLMSRPLDHTRPLWEMYLVEGLAEGRIAVLTKTHQAMVDGISAIDIGQVILDVSAEPRRVAEELWMPRPEPSAVQLVVDAVARGRRPARRGRRQRPRRRRGRGGHRRQGGRRGRPACSRWPAPRAGRRPARPLNVPISTAAPVRDRPHRAGRPTARSAAAHGCTVNDVVLAVVSGALRNWLLSRGEPVTASTTVRAMVPLSVRGEADVPSSAAARHAGQPGVVVPRRPAGRRAEPDGAAAPRRARDARAHRESGQSVGADTLVRIGGFAPPTLHALGARAASGISKRIFNLVVTNVPGPAVPAVRGGRPDAGDVPGGAAGQGPGAWRSG